jgi:hypothetical protein
MDRHVSQQSEHTQNFFSTLRASDANACLLFGPKRETSITVMLTLLVPLNTVIPARASESQ